ncbi:MAG TPA: O-antigen ligase family protein [Puia sp.]|nr:O-antigen ligase family protein [Puia sp.]
MSRQSLGALKERFSKKISDLSVRTFIRLKLNNWLGMLVLGAIACLFGWLLATDTLVGVAFFALIAGLFVVILCFTNIVFGFNLLLFVGFFGYFITNALTDGNLPIGMLYDCLVLINFLGLIMSGKDFKRSWKQFSKNPVVLLMFLSLLYSMVEMFNPVTAGLNATNIMAVRKFLEYILILFMAYTIFDSYQMLRRYIFYMFGMASVCALYGCIQEWHGLFPWELRAIMANPISYGLLFIGGTFRKFSTMNDPASFGVVMSACSVFFIILAIYEKNKVTRLLFIIGIILMILGLTYSGTRTAYATTLGGIVFFVLFNINKPAIQKFAAVMVLLFLALEFGPFSAFAPVRRFRSTFEGSKDESMNVRLKARTWLKPYLYKHPIGGGLGTTGFAGATNYPGNPLAMFMPDGGYVLKAAETGWIGLLLACIQYFIILKTGIRGFFRCKDPTMRIYYSAAVSTIFVFYLAEYTQPLLGGISDSGLYLAFIAIILNLNKHLDDPKSWYAEE